MNKNKEKVPKIRFPGFTEPWEQRKLGDLGEIITGSTPKTNDLSNYKGNYLFVSPVDIQGNRYVEKTITTLSQKGFNSGRQIRKGASLFVSIGSTIGKVAQTAEDSTSNQQINALVSNSNNDDDFIFTLLETQSGKIKAIASNQAVPIVNKTTFGETEVLVPFDIAEQIQIGSYFKKIDNLITLHQRKLNHLKDKKKGLLQKMFPKNGELVPELRFPEFTAPWEQRKLGDMCDEFKSGSSILAKDICEQGEYPVYGGNGLRGYTATYNHDGIYALIGRQGALCGNMNKVYGKAYFTEHAVAVKANKNNNTDFLFFLLDKMNLRQYSGQSAQPGLAVNKLIELITLVPNCSEQKLIGIFFNKLDNLITLHQRKLDHLKEQKKALLQQMFI